MIDGIAPPVPARQTGRSIFSIDPPASPEQKCLNFAYLGAARAMAGRQSSILAAFVSFQNTTCKGNAFLPKSFQALSQVTKFSVFSSVNRF